MTTQGVRPNPGLRSGLTLRRWLKYNAVGAVGIAVQWGVLAYLVRVVGFNYLVATALAVEAALLHNFCWHEQWTWSDRSTGDPRSNRVLVRLARFNVSTGLISIVGNLLVMRALVGGFRLNVILANLVAIATCAVVNFLVNDRWVFSPTQR